MSLCARDVMQQHVLTVHPGMSLAELEDFLVSKRISGAPVVEHGALVGIVSRSDIVRSLSLERSLSGLIAEGLASPESGSEPAQLPESLAAKLRGWTVRDAMVVDPVTVTPETPVAEIARLLTEHHIHRVLVTERKEVRGVISTLDLVQLIAEGRLQEP
jgi:CBS domain-containing protein